MVQSGRFSAGLRPGSGDAGATSRPGFEARQHVKMNFGHRDTVVIGGGVVGSSIAWGLARSGIGDVLVLDGDDLALRASRANFALVWVQGKGFGNVDYALWTRHSAQLWPKLADALREEAETDVALRQPGGFSFCLSEKELHSLRLEIETIDRMTGENEPSFEILNHQQTRERVPFIGSAVVGSIFGRRDGDVNSLRLFRALHTAMLRRGVQYCARHTVDTIVPERSGFLVRGRWGQVCCDRLVLAAGLGGERLASMVGLAAPLVRSKGQVIVTEKCRPFFAYPSGTIRQTDEGGVMIGDSEEPHNASVLTDQTISATLAQRALQTFPLLAELNVVRTWSGFRVQTRDGFPIYEQSSRHPGAFLVTCHSGITLAAGHALDLAPQIAAGELDARLRPFSSVRFDVPQNR